MGNLSFCGKHYCGRAFGEADLQLIRQVIAQPEVYPTRAAIARAVCIELAWLRPDGRLKDMSAKVALLRMHQDGIITLPPPRDTGGNSQGQRRPKLTAASDPGPVVMGTRADLGLLSLSRVANRQESRLWNEFIERYHYLGYSPLPGAQIRYFVKGNDQLVGALGVGASAWTVGSRDRFIGWTSAERKAHLHLVVNNARFLLFPWIRVKNLASSALSLLVRQVRADWKNLYGFEPVLVESFIDSGRFTGTCYHASYALFLNNPRSNTWQNQAV
ncbi:MAG: DUF4338 domain-containing protein [Peptococcaceae bacterium]|jgi:hypothetical protein|nr:DUF4338 domain-containing protein [Peptococcaceae bacterium]